VNNALHSFASAAYQQHSIFCGDVSALLRCYDIEKSLRPIFDTASRDVEADTNPLAAFEAHVSVAAEAPRRSGLFNSAQTADAGADHIGAVDPGSARYRPVQIAGWRSRGSWRGLIRYRTLFSSEFLNPFATVPQ
jgi:hypothetical protein